MSLTKLTTRQNNTMSFTIAFTDNTGTAINITGATVVVTLYLGNSTITSKTITSHTTPAGGVTTCSFSNSETATLPINLLGYEVQLTLVSGSVYSDTGIIEVIKDR